MIISSNKICMKFTGIYNQCQNLHVRSLKALPYELISALDLKDTITADSTQSMSEVGQRPHQNHHFSHNNNDHNIRAVAQKLVKAVLDAAVRRVCGGEKGNIFLKIDGGRVSNLDVAGDMENLTKSIGEIDIWSETCNTNEKWSDCDNSKAPREEEFLFDREHRDYFAKDDKQLKCNIAYDVEVERKGLARRLVLKCIRAACNEISPQELLGGSLESLISSTKRMRIDSPPLFSDAACCSRSISSKTTAMAEPRSPLLDRCLTPESMLRGKLWKKRGRSESHEVNSLLDYNIDCHKIPSTYIKRGNGASLRTCNGNSCVVDDVIDDSSKSEVPIDSIVTGLNKMIIEESFSKWEEEEDECEQQIDSVSMVDGSKKEVKSNVSSLLTFHHCKAPLRSPHPLLTISSDDQISDVRTAANAGCIPEMDFYFIFHSCPPPSVCQKFLCSNVDEINLLFHCWLFKDVPCDPSVTMSDQLEMGVFAPQNVQPVHLELVDGGVPFYFMEPR